MLSEFDKKHNIIDGITPPNASLSAKYRKSVFQ